MDFSTGGRGAIERMVEAYGFTTRQSLCEQLGVSKSSLATRYMRDSFPSDWVIQCALETGSSLEWLVTGKGSMKNDLTSDILRLPHRKIIEGKLHDSSFYFFDKALLPKDLYKPVIISEGNDTFLTDFGFNALTDGKWILEIEGKVSIRNITLIPVGKIKVDNEKSSFECSLEDIKIIAKWHSTLFSD
ncbi:phage repressor protein CI [Klebsiella aerogenes]|uniref:phage repressor protein CI n=1 Tax=Klebsiella aerogenes TaxID=548 RepID=UPI000F7E9193|nr:phage repressor protein CI [Klebsiella aerogenes]EKZ5283054.1 phage repressor protein CI [Klebsiella aerogenes]EKZ6391501.1 phage repressor protein CI [Klebsiella aerogenes]RSW82652.1 phage repressor protein [Klebsiella aerogenes]